MRQHAVDQVVRLCDRSGLLRSTALQAVACLAVAGAPFAAGAQPAPTARPTGGQVVAGQASIAQTTAQTTVNQTSQRAAVNWQGFDVGSQHTVQFRQPSSNAVTLNRVVGPNPSEIAGRIQANGQVVVVNQAGVLFHRGAQVDTAGLVVSAAGISNSNFMAGRMVFDQPAKPGAKIENRGTITIREQGLAALVAPQVANSGVIRAKLGKVILAGAEAHTLDLYGDGLLSINVTRQVQSNPGDAPSLVTNTGTISAAGGTVVLTAEAVDGVVSTLVNSGGRVAANTRGGQTGRVVLSGRGGDVIVAGTVTADGNRAAQTGGTISVAPTGQVAVASTARISASGQAGGGTVAIGVTRARTPTGPAVTNQTMAAGIAVQPGATIAADARLLGSGGNITLLSSGTTRMNGSISARGGSRGGDGGFVEVSGRSLSSVAGKITASAAQGRSGSILLDPDFLDIVNAGSGTGAWDATIGATGTVLASAASIPPDTISNGVLNAFEGNVLLQANQTITVAGSVSLTKQANLSLTLEAGGTITVNSGIVLQASGDIILATGGAGPSSPPTAQASPLISILGTVASTAGTVSLLAGTGGTVSIGGAGVVTGAGATLSSTSGGAITIAGSLAGTGAVALSSGTIALSGTASVTGGTITLTSISGIALNDTSTLGKAGAIVDLSTTGGSVVESAGGTIVAATLRSTSGVTGNVTLSGSANRIASLATFAVSGGTNAFTLVNATDLAIDGPVSAPGNVGVITAGTGRITLNGTIDAGAATVLFSGTGGILLNSGAVIDSDSIGLIGTGGGLSLAAGARVGLGGSLLDIRMDAGGVQQDAGAIIAMGTVQSTGGVTGSVSLAGTANAIFLLKSFAVSGPSANFLLRDTGDLLVGDGVTATGNVSVIAGTTGLMAVTGSIGAGGTLSLLSGDRGIFLNGSAILTGATVALTASGSLDIGAGATLGSAGGVLDLNTTSGGIIQHVNAVIQAGTLTSSSGVTGSAALPGSGNKISSVAAFAVSGADTDFSLANTGNLAITGALTATRDIAITDSGAIATSGSIGAGRTLSLSATSGGGIALNGGAGLTGPTITLSASGAVTMASGSALGQSGGVVDVSTTAGGITQNTGATITAATLRSTSGVGGSVSLAGSANAIKAIAGFAVTGANADLSLTDTGDLAVTGPVTATRDVTLATGGTGKITSTGSIGAGRTLSLASGGGGIALNGGAIVTGPTIVLGGTGPMTLAATALLGQSGAVLDVSTTSGGLTQDAGATIVAAALLSTGGIVGSASLAGVANAIGTIGAFAVSGAGSDVSLVNTGTLVVAGPLTATRDISLASDLTGGITATGSIGAGRGLSLTAGTGGIALNSGAIVTGATLALGSNGGITLLAGASLGQAAATVDVRTLAGDIGQASGATIIAETLTSLSGIGGSASLAGTANTIGTIGAFGVSGAGGDFFLRDTGHLVVAGPLTANGDITLTTGTIQATGSIGAGGTMALTATAGGIAMDGAAILTGPSIALSGAGQIALAAGAGLGQAGALLDLSTTAGGIDQNTGATITGSTLQSTGGVTGSVSLAGTANAIGTLAAFAVSGAGRDFSLLNAGTLVVSGPVTAPRDITLEAGSIQATGSIGAGRSVVVTAVSGGIELDGGAIVGAPTVTVVGAGPITLAAGAILGQLGGQLDLSTSAGGIIQNAGATIVAATLLSSAGVTGLVSLAGTSNAVGTIAAFGVTGVAADFLLIDANDLIIAGPLTATRDVRIGTATIVATGSIGAGGTLALNAPASIALNSGAVLTGPTITLQSASGPITLAAGASLGQTGAAISLSAGAGGIDENAGAVITAATLRSALGVTGSVSLAGTANAIGTIEAFVLSGAGSDFFLLDTGNLTVAGPLTAPRDITLVNGGTDTIAATGSIGAGRSLAVTSGSGGIALEGAAIVTGPTIVMDGGGGAIRLAAGARLGQAGALVDLSTAGGGIDQNAGAVITADLLRSGSGVTGSVALAGSVNAVGTVGLFEVGGAGNGFSFIDTLDLTIVGRLAAPLDIAVTSGAIAASGSIAAGRMASLTAQTGGIALDGAAVVTGTTITLTGVGALTMAAGATIGQAGAVVDLSTSAGGIVQNAGATITAATLRSSLGVTGNVVFDGVANAIGTLAGFAVSGGGNGFSLRDTGDLLVSGPVTAPGTIALATDGTITTAGSIGAGGPLTLTSDTGGIALNAAAIVTGPTITLFGGGGPIAFAAGSRLGQTGASIALTANAGGIAQDAGGTIVAGTLRGTTGGGGAVSLSGSANTIATVTDFSAGGAFSLIDAADLTVSGTISATDLAVQATAANIVGRLLANSRAATVTTTSGALIQSGRIDAVTVASLTSASGILHSGTTTVFGPDGSARLFATTGDVRQSGTVTSPYSVTLTAQAGSILHDGITTAGIGSVVAFASGDITQSGGLIGATEGSVDLTAGGSITQSAGTMTVTGTFTGLSVTLTANGTDAGDGIFQAAGGTVLATTDLGAGVRLSALQDIAVAGTIGATGSASGVALAAAAGNLTQSGTVSADNTVALYAGAALTNAGSVLAGTSAAVTAGAALSNSGTTAAGTEATLTAGTTLSNGGTIIAGTAATLTAGTDLANADRIEAGTNAVLTAGAGLTNGGTIITGTAATLTAGTNLTNADRIQAGTSAALTAGADLTNGGTITAGAAATLTAGTGLTNAGRIEAGASAALTSGTALSNGGTLITGTAATLTAGTDLTNAGRIQAGTNAALTAGADLTNGGTLIAGRDAAVTAATNLTNIGTIAARFRPSLIATDGTLTQDGVVMGGTTVSLFAGAGPLLHGGTTTAGTGGAGIFAGTDIIQTGGTIQASGGAITMAAGRSILQKAGLIQMQSPIENPTIFRDAVPGITMEAGGTGAADGIIQSPGGMIIASPGIAFFTASNRIDLAGLVSATGSRDGVVLLWAKGAGSSPGGPAALALSGSITAGSRLSERVDRGDILHASQATIGLGGVTIEAQGGSFHQTGGAIQTSGPGIAVLTPAGAINQTAGTMAAASSVDLIAANGITQGGAIRVASGIATLSTTDGPLTQTGAIEAQKILFSNINGPVTISGTLTGLTPSRLQSKARFAIAQSDFPAAANDTGVFITTGSAAADTDATHAITFDGSASATSGQAQLVVTMVNNDAARLNINATNVDLFLALQTGAASGNVFVSSLHVGYPQPGTSGEVALEGTVNGLTGQDTAPASFIQPLLKSNYMINGCAIQSISCVLITTSRVPVDNPLKNVQTGQNRSLSDVHVILPDVAERDY